MEEQDTVPCTGLRALWGFMDLELHQGAQGWRKVENLFKGYRNKSKVIETTTSFRVIDATLSHDIFGAGA